MKSNTQKGRIALLAFAMVLVVFVSWCGNKNQNTNANTWEANTWIVEVTWDETNVPSEITNTWEANTWSTENTWEVVTGTVVSSETTSYKVPSGDEEKITVTLTLDADSKISDLAIKYEANNPTSKQMQNRFDAEIKSVVIGKTIDQAKVDIVNGASLTSAAFNNALDTIK